MLNIGFIDFPIIIGIDLVLPDEIENQADSTILIYDGYGIINPPTRKDINVYRIDAMDKAAEMQNSKVFNMIVLGGLLKVCPVVSTDGISKALFKSLPERHHPLIPLNMQAVDEGMNIITKI